MAATYPNDQGNPAGAIPVYLGAKSGAPVTGQKTVTASAVQFTAQALTMGVYFTAPAGNSASIEIGPAGVTTTTGYKVAAGQTSPLIPVANMNQLYLIGANTSDTISWVGF